MQNPKIEKLEKDLARLLAALPPMHPALQRDRFAETGRLDPLVIAGQRTGAVQLTLQLTEIDLLVRIGWRREEEPVRWFERRIPRGTMTLKATASEVLGLLEEAHERIGS